MPEISEAARKKAGEVIEKYSKVEAFDLIPDPYSVIARALDEYAAEQNATEIRPYPLNLYREETAIRLAREQGESHAFARLEALAEKYKYPILLRFPVPAYQHWIIEIVGYREIIGDTPKAAVEQAESEVGK